MRDISNLPKADPDPILENSIRWQLVLGRMLDFCYSEAEREKVLKIEQILTGQKRLEECTEEEIALYKDAEKMYNDMKNKKYRVVMSRKGLKDGEVPLLKYDSPADGIDWKKNYKNRTGKQK